MAPSKKRASKLKSAEYRFAIDAYTPETMPMARLAEYMAHLAQVLGEPASVHFVRLEPGSTALVHRIEREAIPKVRTRANAIRTGEAPRDAIRAYHTINKMLRDDNGVGRLTEGKREIVLHFPGRDDAEEKYPSVRQQGSLDGRVMRVGGLEPQSVPLLLQSEEEIVAGCHTNRAVAKQLAQKLFEYVRLYGIGKWQRDAEGVWSLVDFSVTNFEVLRDDPFSSALSKIREVSGELAAGAYEELEVIRHGKPRRRNGGD